MKVKKIFLENFRNYENAVVEFSDGVNILQGRNAQGKTNLLEAIYFCAIGKSLRVSREREVIKFNKNTARIKILIEKKYKNTEIYLIKKRGGEVGAEEKHLKKSVTQLASISADTS